MGFRSKRKVIPAKTPGELDAMQAAGEIVGEALQAVRAAAAVGVSTLELDAIAEQTIRDRGAIPTFKGYGGFPGSICASVNDVIVHGIPNKETILKEGDLVSIDCGATLDGWVGDSAWTFGIGTITDDVRALNEATEWVLYEGMKAMIPGNRLTDVSHALEMATRAAEKKFNVQLGIVNGYGGHGIGHEMHEEPYLANEGKGGRGPMIQEGSVLAIEPMLTLGSVDSIVLADEWTVVTDDNSWSSHWEHTVAAINDGPRILTPRK
ncbi:type I methionyl aminopeptidase [Corynebacterium diphtheriae]|uniref:type I methionyl aminopeptidase n=1 Tax=Corynebacterium diphtheriae TaxID=1717 RepID=UPI0003903031|nr:type I methionyl aminopeptidase [Corynebacterium diphtheriae]ERA54114.1 methionine aminopeptidase [Corynebacterium diphtheriae str. Aberdeen]KLN42886.1 methionine aminopeptidase [Corynebacterium diphtheriae bv. gravis str. ISS 4746]KLN45026.1 methionine aminopeptidase [Corynebacterium diphtheriae bv. gravis str. ISS 4749]MBG9368662.1 type I methionyl aminopeptidase [Corynebacterium diphtheriae bv. gravis]MBG9379416.1 type I methionyl aminopeptidase [Corynebacterium diphtheriae bv. gravis]